MLSSEFSIATKNHDCRHEHLRRYASGIDGAFGLKKMEYLGHWSSIASAALRAAGLHIADGQVHAASRLRREMETIRRDDQDRPFQTDTHVFTVCVGEVRYLNAAGHTHGVESLHQARSVTVLRVRRERQVGSGGISVRKIR